MSTAGRGIRDAFRNRTRTVAIVLILALAIGPAFVMLIAHRVVGQNASTALSSVGNTVTIGPPGYSAGGQFGPKTPCRCVSLTLPVLRSRVPRYVPA